MTVGLKRAGFNVVGAVEIEKNAVDTYKVNHPEVTLFDKDIRDVSGKELKRLSPTGKVDLLAGCPPCQGFSSLTSKYKSFDERNLLIREVGRLIEEIKPRAVMIENVPGLADKGEMYFNEFLRKLKSLGYETQWKVLQVADYGIPQSRRRLVLIAGRRFRISIPEPTHSRTGEKGLKEWKTLREVIKGMPRPVKFDYAKKNGGADKFGWHVIRNITSTNLDRLKFAKPGKSRAILPKRYRPDCHKDTAKGFGNVYGRMSWDQPSVTITGGCTTVSKGRFGHPTQRRTISVREAALLQTFPKNYKLGTLFMDKACDIIGNALPCLFAKKMAKQCYKSLAVSSVK